jgi:general secretion pathway protein N
MKLLKPSLPSFSVSARRKTAAADSSRATTWGLVGALVGAFLALLLNLPAPWLAQGLSEISKGQLQLQEAQGSVWNGSGKLVLTGGAGSRDALALPGRILWHLNVSFNTSRWPAFHLNVQASCCMAQAVRIQLTPANTFQTWRLQADDHRSEWPAQWLSGLGAPWNTLQPEGTLVLETKQLMLHYASNQTQLQGSLHLTAQDLSSKLSTLKPMGTYVLSLANANSATDASAKDTSANTTSANASPQLTLRTQSGSLLLSGQGHWQGTQFQFRGEASAVPEHAAALSNLLNIIGRRQGARSLLSLG